MRKIKRLLKPLYHEFMALQCVFERTIFAPIHNIHVPLNKNVKIGKNVKFYNSSRIIYYDGLVSIGPNTEVCSFSKFIIGGGRCTVGRNCLLGEYGIYNIFDDLIIGDHVMTADRVSFVTNIHEYDDINLPIKLLPSKSNSIVIGDGTWIGMNATILAGSHIGTNCVVAAHSVVKGNFPDCCVIGGIPARILKRYDFQTQKWVKV